MLELKNIKKDYPTGAEVVHALKGIDIRFRKSEFVAILGPSGCGKTTTLNIIGGLDQYTEGDLVINGVSTKDYKDRDWDAYRNHSVGFVFQSYNLIPHQSVLQNVELALTLSGVSKSERRERAIKALQQVGLGDQLKKKPSEMSGGQMQRVAIARAIVNDPDIILADEPTGALDSVTSVQVMEILKEIAKDRLVVMVTHNAEIANQYATRTITMLDGSVTGDTMPLDEAEYEAELASGIARAEETKKTKLPSMSLKTSFGLSLKNLFTKKGRTLLTAFAGSIGIIGIALVVAVSNGTTNYIDQVQEETLSSYPLTLEAAHTDLGSLAEMFMGAAESESEHGDDAAYPKSALYDLLDAFNNLEAEENDLASFKEYLTEQLANKDSDLSKALSGVQYSYDLDLQFYTKNESGEVIKSETQEMLQQCLAAYMGMDSSSVTNWYDSLTNSSMSSLFGSSSTSEMTLWEELLPGTDGSPVNSLVKKQYDLVYGSWPTKYNEVVLVLDENNEIDDVTIYALGLMSSDDLDNLIEKLKAHEEYDGIGKSWSYEELCNHEYRVVLPSDCYTYDSTTGTYTDLRETSSGLAYLYDNALDIKVVGVIRPNPDATATMLNGSIAYTSNLTEYVIEHSQDSAVVKAQKASPNVDVLTGLPFKDSAEDMTTAEKAAGFKEYASSLDNAGKASVYVKIMSIAPDDVVKAQTEKIVGNATRESIEEMMLSNLAGEMSVSEDEIKSYLASMSDEELMSAFRTAVEEQVKEQYASKVSSQLSSMSNAQLAAAFDAALATYTDDECASYYENVLEFSESTYEDNLVTFGCIDLSKPASINLFASSFANKDVITDAIASYNEGQDETSQIKYTDYVGLMMSSITTIINAITYILLAFIAVSLIVSSIMIGVITLISVQERTKEIGILRAIGASKRNVSTMFNAETVIIGFVAGAIGVGFTYLVCIPINLLIHLLTGIEILNASLPISVAIALVIISVLLTLIAGIIPSRSAAKKDPVVALRTE